MLKASDNFLTHRYNAVIFYFCVSCLSFFTLSCLFLIHTILWSPFLENTDLLAFLIWCPRSGEVLDCIDSWPLPWFLPCYIVSGGIHKSLFVALLFTV